MLTTIEIIIILGVALLTTTTIITCWLYFYKRIMNKITRKNVLNREECRNFFKGIKVNTDPTSKNTDTNSVDALDRMGYIPSLEIPKKNFKIDTMITLDAGLNGNVYAARVSIGGETIDAAAQMTDSSSSKISIKGLMREIKVLSYLGKHENIILLIGAHTQKLSNGKLYMFTEVCPGGTLETHLRSYNPKFCINSESGNGKANYEDNISPYLLIDLYLWSNQIAQGMQFLASKQVVHSNLCTRNVVLGELKEAKICGFEMANRHDNFTYYSEKQQGELLWRWSAPETLRRLAFSEKTDVWSYGVTLWEIYTLGELPYSDVLGNEELLAQILEERTLPMPQYSRTLSLYDDIMQKCFELNPNDRPTFVEINTCLNKLTAR